MNIQDRVEHTLKAAGVTYRFIPLPEDLPMTITDHTAFHKDTLEHAMATIVYKTEKGLIAVTKRGDTQIDEKKLRELAGVKQLIFATKEELVFLGTDVGLVPYVGLDTPYFVDSKVLNVGKAYGTPGIKTLGMVMDAKDMVKVNGGKVGDFTYFEKSREMLKSGKQRILSGITPSGEGSLHIGNYLGAVRQFATLSKTNECFLMVADLHALTTVQNKKQLEHNVETLVLNELALLMGDVGADLPNITFFRQSDIPMHTELQSILNNVTPLGLIKRAHAYKDKLANPSTTLRQSSGQALKTGDAMDEEINVGLFSYPILMAADILIYKPDLVPVGKDQKQHVEITRDIAERFNKTFNKKVFKLPEPHIPEEVAVILGTDGKRKMSKSLGNIISIFESEEVIRKQVNSTYTDPTRIRATDPGHIEGNMVFTYLDHFGDPNSSSTSSELRGASKVEQLKKLYQEGKVSDVEVKEYLFESLMKTFAPARKHYQELKNSPSKVRQILETGAARVRSEAVKTMNEVREAVGLTNSYSFFSYSSSHSGKPQAHPESGTRKDSRIEFGTGSGQAKMTGIGNNVITIDDFARVEMRVGLVKEAIDVPKSEKLIKLTVDFGAMGLRTIFTGVRPFGYTALDFNDKKFLFVFNLLPRKMMNEESQGMILAVDSPRGEAGGDELPFGVHGAKKPVFVTAEGLPVGAKVR
ncbi:MAG: Tryptophan-tRNA ligase [Candidatus Gottesmanbacteria bacterium GW2011_GWB1_43_11]|uniref:Tryptophan--tRNA ligase n=1 Tax=Candidatus Gottesmanbacteria bacterium GW2011_GWB1_43_11 TaxID=1618446 RepID=A0A0G1CPQ8_9BACT|nr:MAG: Tryptophan-tRNA ligase [Candidatus Gottesmanbacteria bacterium GW2011_GWA2_42_16]KKS56072.1 MAG: Tryptophan-tRNA ligase [Candidatus Gottesmanbacteria bacterium GW2011_GWA1_42_26]KKS81617.1 MAG: Tryptophan-tRNA ligase [Candidatus Gottesmanbacteria bacterium GW2011_GWC1_43_10]KKS87700.1 MAG: Tryptophan-tRNA ligase [Candidatus Gottesmanbacteria bacterium GW2011_GWB1_43_11]OGG07514.1 MAG: tryptophan--tRNA ligase [Candidatus Gottesmanbacteria bacterium RIFCSPHIGHO2_01_FULL_43_15]HCM37465.1 